MAKGNFRGWVYRVKTKVLQAVGFVFLVLMFGGVQAQTYLSGSFGGQGFASAGVGYQFTPYLSAEASVLRYNSTLGGKQADTEGEAAAVLLSYPLHEDWTLVSRFAANYLTTEQRNPTVIVLSPAKGEFEDGWQKREWAASVGAGVQYKLAQSLRLRVMLEHFASDKPVNVLSAGLLVGF